MSEVLLLNGLELNKKSVETIRNEISEKVINGDIDPIKVYANMKFLEKVFNGDDKKNNGLSHLIKSYVVDEIEKDKHKTDYYGFKVAISETGARYNFDNCGHKGLEDLYEQQKELNAKIKEIETMLKGIPKGGHLFITDEETGEQMKVYAPVKSSTTSPIFTMK